MACLERPGRGDRVHRNYMDPEDHVLFNLVWVTMSHVILDLFVAHAVPCIGNFLFRTYLSRLWGVSTFRGMMGPLRKDDIHICL